MKMRLLFFVIFVSVFCLVVTQGFEHGLMLAHHLSHVPKP
jgi:hypothetical protein